MRRLLVLLFFAVPLAAAPTGRDRIMVVATSQRSVLSMTESAHAVAASADASIGDCMGGTQYPCVPIYEPSGDGGSGGVCPTPRDKESCNANCLCVYAKNVDKCRKERAGWYCEQTAATERKACL